MFGPVRPTPYDLYFSIFGVPVRVNPFFWAMGTILGWRLMQAGPEYLLMWIGCIFVSILIHELGHVFAMNYYGIPAHIILYHFGGLAVPESSRGLTHGKSIVISLSGPGAGFLFLGLINIVAKTVFKDGFPNALTAQTFYQLQWINLGWGVINLLPVLPLDGGHVARDTCFLLRLRDPIDAATKLSILASGLAAYFFFTHGMRYAGFMFGYMCFVNFQELNQGSRRY
jgi:stage IV sporulation protein FB